MGDQELLLQFAHDGTSEAFAELVRRHVTLVYSVARRMVGSTSAAEEVTQTVFVALAQNANRIKSGTPLIAWLHLVSRRASVDWLRRESRRATRQATALEIAHVNAPDSNWEEIEPLLDEAVESLSVPDRTAILLRYFEDKSFREVAECLGTSEDGAQKRVSRTLERLRKFFHGRGVTVSASGLVTTLASRAVETPPSSVLASASTVATSALVAPALSLPSTLVSLTMTTVQKSFLTATLACVAAGGWYQASVIRSQQRELDQAHVAAGDLAAQIRRLQEEAARRPVATASVPAVNPARLSAETEIETWISRLLEFKRRVGEMKDKQIPEMQFLTEQDWVTALYGMKLSSDLEVRKALSSLRNTAKRYFVQQLGVSLRAYLKANNGQMPTDLNQLVPYFQPPVDPAILARYEIQEADPASKTPFRNMPIREKAPVDEYYDTLVAVGRQSNGTSGESAKGNAVGAAVAEFRRAHAGAIPTRDEIAPYLKTDVDPVFLQEILDNYAGR